MKNFAKIASAVLLSAVVALPMFAARGSANFSSFVALGDSYGVGYSNGSMNERHQQWSWPAIIARQVGLTLCTPGAAATDNCFAQPLVSYPGIGPELQLINVAPTILPASGQGQPIMTTFGRPYNNLSIPGATVGAQLALTGAEPPQAGEPGAVSAGRFILRGLGTPVAQALAQHPTFIAVWIGGNDYLSIVASGTPASMTSVADFKTRYETLINALTAGAPNAGFVVGTLPDSIPPYLTLVPPVLVDPATRQPILVGGAPVFFIAKNDDGTVGQITQGTLLPLQTRDKLAQGYGLPPALKAIPPFSQLPHTGEPLEANDVLTPAEMQTIIGRIAEFNAIIKATAAAKDIPVADIEGLFERAVAGVQLGPIRVTNAFITGGFFGLDGVHLTDLGYLMFANEYIKAINAGYDAGIPLASITQLWTNNGADFDEGFDSSNAAPSAALFSSAAIRQIQSMWAQPTTRRMRAASH